MCLRNAQNKNKIKEKLEGKGNLRMTIKNN
jgi:hypothetical protein